MNLSHKAALGLGALAALALAAPAAHSQELIQNGGFETGTLSGWTTAATTAPGNQLTAPQVTTARGGYFGDSAPLSGSFDALNGFDGAGPFTCDLYQTVALPTGTTVTFSSNERIQSALFNGVTPRTFTINVEDTHGGILSTLFTQTLNPSDFTVVDTGWVNHTFDISQYAGQTVRLDFHEEIPQNFTGPAQIEFDTISAVARPAAVPEPSQTAALGLGALGVLGLLARARRRRPAAA